jgi:hypothetical protein
MALSTSYAIDSEPIFEAVRNASHLPQKQASAKMASMATSVIATPAAPAKAPAPSSREQGAKLLHGLCNASDPQKLDRLAKELDAHLMKNE